MAITLSASDCHTASCPADLNPNCPAELQQLGADGSVVGCKSACYANLDGNQYVFLPTLTFNAVPSPSARADSANCCSGSHNTADTCPPDGVQYYDYFKDSCEDSYVYAYDESSGTALWTCPDTNAAGASSAAFFAWVILTHMADYTLTFCP